MRDDGRTVALHLRAIPVAALSGIERVQTVKALLFRPLVCTGAHLDA